MFKKRERLRNGPWIQTDLLKWPIKCPNIFLVNQENANLNN